MNSLRPKVFAPDPIVVSTAVGSCPRPITETIGFLEKYPLSLWQDHLSDPQPLLDTLIQLQKSHASFLEVATQLDFLTSQFVRQRHAQKNVISANDNPIRFYIIGRLQGILAEQVLPWLDRDLSAKDRFETEYVAILSHKNFNPLSLAYLDSKRQLQEVHDQIKTLVGNTQN